MGSWLNNERLFAYDYYNDVLACTILQCQSNINNYTFNMCLECWLNSAREVASGLISNQCLMCCCYMCVERHGADEPPCTGGLAGRAGRAHVRKCVHADGTATAHVAADTRSEPALAWLLTEAYSHLLELMTTIYVVITPLALVPSLLWMAVIAAASASQRNTAYRPDSRPVSAAQEESGRRLAGPSAGQAGQPACNQPAVGATSLVITKMPPTSQGR